MSKVVIESREKVKNLLKQLFRSDMQDLDTGIYRILNHKRDQIEKFIEIDLIQAAEEEFREFANVGVDDLKADVEKLRDEINHDFGQGTIDEHGRVTRSHEAPKIREYIRKCKELESAGVTQEQINDVFNHIYEFFSRYYDKGDFISKRRYGGRDKYYIPYNGEETALYWANRDQYYVKTDEYFKKYQFKVGEYRVVFVLAKAEVRQNNNKGDERYFLLHKNHPVRINPKEHILQILFEHRPLNEEDFKNYGLKESSLSSTKADNIRKKIVNEIFESVKENKDLFSRLKRIERGKEKTCLETHLYRYTTERESDYFVHKELRSFLERELGFYIKNEVFDLDEYEVFNERSMKLSKAKVHAIRNIGKKIINFLAQIENFQKMLFEKKKFILKTDYCITLDLVPEKFYEEIGENKQQVAEWKELFKLHETTKDTLQSTAEKGTLDVEFLRSHKHLVLDTRFFSQGFKDRLLNSFDDLEGKIDGLLIKSENFQALNIIMEKYKGKIKCVYIDPPYNTGSDEFLYKDNYQHSSWLSMMKDRLALAWELMNYDGVLFMHIDENEQFRLRLLLASIFGPNNYIAPFVWPSRAGRGGTVAKIQIGHEYIECIAKDKQHANFKPMIKEVRGGNYTDEKGTYHRELLRQWGAQAQRREDRPSMYFPIPTPYGIDVYPTLPDGSAGRWRFGLKSVLRMLSDGDLDFVRDEKTGEITVYRKIRAGGKTFSAPSNILDDVGSSADGTKEIQSLFGEKVFDTCKPLKLAERLVELITWRFNTSVFVLDFFAGSGTTAHAVINLNQNDSGQRKYILVEMADYFDTVLKRRIEKVMYSGSWKNGVPASNEGVRHMFKYIYLEQYEDTLNNIVFRSLDRTIQEKLDSFKDYFVRYMLDYETQSSPTRLLLDRFKTPFDYKIKTLNGGEEKTETVDLVETFNYLLGLSVDKIRTYKHGKNEYRVVIGKNGKEKIAVIWRNLKDLNLKEDRIFIEENVLSEFSPDQIYINGDSYVKNAKPIEPEFRRLMGA